ncbi:MAG: FtsX-like permease family protein [Tyzzerella sp.]|nr:FtsX-like permease family protein [Tyzzerella sp.]
MSGGQMQRVAIARALVNNPDILLADEPTGALDTETSVQVMELLKKVAHDRLVIMVTHNPELAEEYSTRIAKLKDGKILDDSDPFVPNEKELLPPEHKNLGKSSMSILTALSLSFNNLLTKKGRTLLTAFAGSIGIIGIALILSLSTGFQNYIDQIQEDTLTSYPLSVMSETADTTSMLLSMATQTGESEGGDVVEERQYISTMFSKIGTNDLKSFKKYLEKNSDEVDDMVSLVRYQYSVNPMIYTKDVNGDITQLNPSKLLSSLGASTMMSSSTTSVFTEMIDDQKMLEEQYNVLAGKWPESYDEVILVLPEPNGISDLLLYSLGLRDSNELQDMLTKIMAGEAVENTSEPLEYTYDELMNISLKLVDASDTYKYNETYNIYESMTEDAVFMQGIYDNALDLKIVGIVCAKKSSSSMMLTTGVAYTKELTEYVIEQAEESEIVQKQLANEEVNVFSNKRFDDDSEESGLNFEDMISIDTELLSSAFGMNISESDISNMTQGYMGEISSAITTDTAKAEVAFNETLKTLATDMMTSYVEENKNPIYGNMAAIKMTDVDQVVNTFMSKDTTKAALAKLEAEYLIPQDTFAEIYAPLLKGAWQGYITYWASLNAGNQGADKPTTETPDTENSDGGALSDQNSGAANVGTTTTVTEIPSTGNVEGNTDVTALLTADIAKSYLEVFMTQSAVSQASQTIAGKMTEAVMQKTILSKVGELTQSLMGTMSSSFNVDQSKIASAFKFDLSEEELTRLMKTMSASSTEKNANTNLLSLGYQDLEEPTSISFYFNDFESKELFLDFLDEYNEKMEKEDDEKVIKYTDLTGILMSSVKTIVDSVSYVLIAFVSISLIVSSIMIGIITYISVLERTKEIGVLRAIGASKKNISSIFNAETFIVGLCSGLIGILITLALLVPINYIIHTLTGNLGITAVLPVSGGATLVILSVILTLIGGLIPSKQAAKKDPVLALRSE